MLGLAEGACFPAAIKAVTEWFPKEQRALTTGIFNAGSPVGAILCPLAVPWLAGRWGWQCAFVATGAAGFIWVALWGWLYQSPDQHARVSPEELAYIRKDPPESTVKIPWLELLRHRQTWAFLLGMMASAPVWWFFIFWTPDFLNKRFGLNLTQSSLPLMIIFFVSSFGGIAGGWLSSVLPRRPIAAMPPTFTPWSATPFHGRRSARWSASAVWRARWRACSLPRWCRACWISPITTTSFRFAWPPRPTRWP
jgi:ACS family hexuronate transporter-like MFS transporter